MSKHKAIYGIVGYPVKHSLSPLMHNTAFAELGVEAVYKLFPVKEEKLSDFFDKLREKDNSIFGLNVTVPYKENVIAYMDSLSPFAEKAMSVNTVVISKDRKLVGYNTDGPGFLSHLAEFQYNIQGKRIAILGAGGTTRALLAALCLLPERPESIRIYNRTPLKAKELLKDLSQRIDIGIVNIVSSIDDLNIELADLLINTTSIGLKEKDNSLVSGDLLHSNLFVYDVIYNNKETQLLKLAKQKGAMITNGLGMLFYQGVLSFQHWSEVQLDPEVKEKMRNSLQQGKV